MTKVKTITSLLLILAVCAVSTIIPVSADTTYVEPQVIPFTSNITSYIGKNVNVKFKLFHEYYDEMLYVNVYDSKGKVVASAEDYFDEDDADEQIYTFTWLAKNAAAGKYTVYATGSYYTDGEWHLCSTDAIVAITLKAIPAPKLKSAINAKGKKITAKWSAVKKAAKYQVKIGSKTYSTKKTSYTAKKLKKGKTYAVKVRTYMNKKWSKWSNVKKVKIKK